MPALGTVNSTTSITTSAELATAVAGLQPIDSDLTAIAALTTTSFGRSLLEAANAAALRTLAGTDAVYQPSDSDLTAIAALTTTSYGRSLLEAANAAALRTLAGISAANTPFTPNGSIAATDVQAAIQEVRDEAGSGGAPTDVDYLVGTASGGLSAEIVVGASPGGELGGTWASPTVDATHSGSTHAATQAAAEATAAGALATHEADTTAIHGIANTANLYAAGGTDVAVADGGTGASTASGARTNLGLAIGTDVPGQAAFDDHSARHDAGGADVMAIDAAQATGSLRTITTSAAQAVGTAAAGNGTAAASSNHVHPTGAGTPSTQAFGDAAATGSGPAAAMTDHKHAMPADPVTAHAAAADPHAGYVLESLFDAKGDLIAASADNTPAIVAVGANDTILMADSAQAAGLKWVASQTPSTQAFSDAAAEGTADTYARGDHKHAMPANPGGGVGAGFFGDGSDGALSLTQASAAPAYATKSGSGATTLFTLTRDVYATTFDLDDSGGAFLVRTNGFRLWANVSLTIDAGVTVHNDGNAAAAATAGANQAAGTIGQAAGAGSAGAVNTTATQAAAVTFSAATTSTSNTAHGGTGGAATGGGTGGGVAGGTVSRSAISGTPGNLSQAYNVRVATSALTAFAGGGGGTGGNATGGTTATGGGGGGGAGIVAIYAKLLTNNGVIRVQGGAGGNAALGNGTGAGGGAGGGGGAIVLVYGTGSTTGTLTVTGGVGGTLAGTGATGGTGVSGLTYQLQL